MDNFDIRAAVERTYSGKRFTKDLEWLFRSHRRRRFHYSRTGLYLVLTLVFIGSQLRDGMLFAADEVSYPLLHTLSVYVAAPANALALLALLFSRSRQICGATQVAAAAVSLLCTVCLHSVAVGGHLDYPSHLTGLLVIAIAVIGGYSWKRVLVGTILFACLAIWSELRVRDGAALHHMDVYSMAIMSAIAIASAVTHEFLARLAWLYNRYAEHLARTDPLTGLASRLEFNRSFPRLLAQAQRDRRMIAVMLLDLDHFKKINDDNGHLAGDEVLRALGRVLLTGVARRPLDLRVRYGGEEVLVVWYDVNAPAARTLAESTLQLVRTMQVPLPGSSRSLQVTASAGITWLVPTAAATPSDILNMADELLYAAKAAGRNCAMAKPFERSAV